MPWVVDMLSGRSSEKETWQVNSRHLTQIKVDWAELKHPSWSQYIEDLKMIDCGTPKWWESLCSRVAVSDLDKSIWRLIFLQTFNTSERDSHVLTTEKCHAFAQLIWLEFSPSKRERGIVGGIQCKKRALWRQQWGGFVFCLASLVPVTSHLLCHNPSPLHLYPPSLPGRTHTVNKVSSWSPGKLISQSTVTYIQSTAATSPPVSCSPALRSTSQAFSSRLGQTLLQGLDNAWTPCPLSHLCPACKLWPCGELSVCVRVCGWPDCYIHYSGLLIPLVIIFAFKRQ